MESELTIDDERTLLIRLTRNKGSSFNVVVQGKQMELITDAIENGEGFSFYDYDPANPGGYTMGPGEIVGAFAPEEQIEKGYECSQK